MGTRKIAKKLGLSRNTVKNALKSEDAPEYKRETYINPELETFHDFILEKYFVKKLKGSRVLNELRSKGCKVSSSAFYRYIHMYSLSQTQSSVFEALEEGLTRIGGVPERIQTDNHATLYIAIKKEWNPRYLQFASHYGFQPSRSEFRSPCKLWR